MFLNVSLPTNFGLLYGQKKSIIFRCGENYAVNVNKMLFFALIFFCLSKFWAFHRTPPSLFWANFEHFARPLPPYNHAHMINERSLKCMVKNSLAIVVLAYCLYYMPIQYH